MKVYKFGGASVRSAEGIRNISRIVSGVNENLFIVVSAMGKTTNAMEVVLDCFMKADHAGAIEKLVEVENYHREIIAELFADKAEAIRSEALEDAVKFLEENGMIAPNGFTAAGIRGLK